MTLTHAEPPATACGPHGKAAALDSHSLPMFEGAASRRHGQTPLRSLRRRAWAARLAAPRRLRRVRSLVQFAGYPRSGHSLIGALLDSHPDAVIAHELDAMGLFRKGVSVADILRLCDANAARFARDGRWWNGFSYDVPGALAPRPPRVIGDKKGDWALRWCAATPDLARRLAGATPLGSKWILVTRHPLDTVATMSLRQGRLYDKLRIARPGDAAAAIRAAQDAGDIAAEASDAMVQDFRALSAAAAALRASLPGDAVHEIAYERFVADAPRELARLCAFLGLDPDPAWIAAAAAIVAPRPSRSRARLAWRDDQVAALARTAAAHEFLEPYRDDF